MFRERSAAVVAAAALLWGCQPVGQGDDGRDASVGPVEPGGQHLTYEPRPFSEGPLLAARDPGRLVAAGRTLFYRDWLATTDGGVPLAGPDYDAATCSACHVDTARPSAAAGRVEPPLVARPVDARDRAEYGPQLQQRRYGPGEPAARVRVDYVRKTHRYPDGESIELRAPIARAITRDGETIPMALRAAPLLFGWGLLERVDPGMLELFEDPGDRDGDGISGRLARIDAGREGASGGIGMFGWKGSHGSLRAQIRAALANDMGVIAADDSVAGGDAEMSARELDALEAYVRRLGVPDSREGASERGQDLFGLTGCSSCHVAVLRTTRTGDATFSEQIIWPFTDLMLHDMGSALADPGHAAGASEWRTAPLWGLGIVEKRFPARGFLHDGRARTIEEAILWHGGEAAGARRRFSELSPADRAALLEFVRTL